MSESEPGQEIEIKVDWSTEGAPVYANGAQVVHTQREFSLVFTDFATFEGRGEPDGEGPPRARVVASVRLTPDVFFQLTAACASNWNKFVGRFGEGNPQTPRFKLTPSGDVQLEGVD